MTAGKDRHSSFLLDNNPHFVYTKSMSYKKRARAGYESDMKSANDSERIYAKKEIRDELDQIEKGDEFREKGSNKKNLSRKEKQERRVERCRLNVERKKGTWICYLYESWYRREKEKLDKL